MKNASLIIGIGITAIAIIIVGYFISQRQVDDLIDMDTVVVQPMTERICEEQGGHWGEIEIIRDSGDETLYQCECPNDGYWIRQGEKISCEEE